VLEDGGNGKDSVLADIGVSVLQALAGRRKQWFYEFRLPQFAQVTQRIAANEFVGMLKVHSNSVASTPTISQMF
jgi:hypothetical protein